MRRSVRLIGTVVLTAAAVAYLVWRIDLGETLDVLADADLAWFAVAVLIMVVTVPVLAARWRRLLTAHGISEPLRWLTRAYFVAYTAGQFLPTSLGGDAVRVVDTARRHPGRTAGLAYMEAIVMPVTLGIRQHVFRCCLKFLEGSEGCRHGLTSAHNAKVSGSHPAPATTEDKGLAAAG